MEYSVKKNEHPNRLWAIPLAGILKVVILIPIFIWIVLVGIALAVCQFINSFIVLFSGKYWNPAYEVLNGFLSLKVKSQLFLTGLSDKYPSFSLKPDDPHLTLHLKKPEKPNRLYAIPIFGGLFRIIILVPYIIYTYVIDRAAQLGVVASFVKVLFKGVYPDSTYEFYRDAIKLSLNQSLFFAGINDAYPDFKISWNHKNIKIALIVISLLFSLTGIFNQKEKSQPSSSPPPTKFQDFQDNQSLNNDKVQLPYR